MRTEVFYIGTLEDRGTYADGIMGHRPLLSEADCCTLRLSQVKSPYGAAGAWRYNPIVAFLQYPSMIISNRRT